MVNRLWGFVRHHKDTLAFLTLTAALLIGIWRVETLAVRNCENVEALKSVQREAARENYANLERNARLLKLELTPELRRVAREGRDATLKRFASHRC